MTATAKVGRHFGSRCRQDRPAGNPAVLGQRPEPSRLVPSPSPAEEAARTSLPEVGQNPSETGRGRRPCLPPPPHRPAAGAHRPPRTRAPARGTPRPSCGPPGPGALGSQPRCGLLGLWGRFGFFFFPSLFPSKRGEGPPCCKARWTFGGWGGGGEAGPERVSPASPASSAPRCGGRDPGRPLAPPGHPAGAPAGEGGRRGGTPPRGKGGVSGGGLLPADAV